MNCPACARPRLDDAQRFCGSCGAPFSDDTPAGTLVDAAPVVAPPPSAITRPIGPGGAYDIPRTGPRYGVVTPMARRAGGPACPVCFSVISANQFTPWHAVIAILMFPIGVGFLLVPVHICENGHRFGPGIFVVNAIKVLLIVITVVIVLALWLLFDSFRQIAHVFG